MCGLVAIINKNRNGFTGEQRDVFNTLLYISGLFRGDDGCGIVSVDNIGNVKLAKSGMDVPNMQRTKEYGEVTTKAFNSGWALFGHNRAATRGVVNDENAHPFVADNIVLVHNGTFQGDHKKLHDTEVDSEAIAKVLAESTDSEQALRRINAAFALIWYNIDTKTLHVIRNSQRTLFFFETHNSFVFASEKSFLNFVIDKFDLKPLGKGVELLAEHVEVTYKLEDNGSTKEAIAALDCSYWKHNTQTGGGQTSGPFRGSYLGYESDADDGYDAYWAGRRTGHGAWNMEWPDEEDAPTLTSQDFRTAIQKLIGSQAAEIVHEDWKNNLLKEFTKGSKIKVYAYDLLEADDNPKTKNFVVIGKAISGYDVHVAFLIRDVEFEKLTDMMDSAVFEVTVDVCSWQTSVFIENEPNCTLDKMKGMVVIHASNPSPVYAQAGTSC